MRPSLSHLSIYLLLLTLFVGCASPVVNLESARINKQFHLSAFSQRRIIEHHSNYRPGVEWKGDPFDHTANANLLKLSYGFLKNNIGLEFGIKVGT